MDRKEIDWKNIDTDRCCIAGIYEYIDSITYFPTVTDGILADDGLAQEIKGVATSEMQKYFPNCTPAWAYLTFLLKTSICYVEYSGYNGQLKKMLLCSNMNLLRACKDFKIGDFAYHLTDATNVGKFNGTHVNGGINIELRTIKVNKKMLTVPKTPLLIKGSTIRVAPLCLLLKNAAIISNGVGITEYKYFKDNGSMRTLVTTKDRGILIKHYTSEKASEMIDNATISLDTLFNRGYIRLVELGASKYDSGVRAINVAKIKGARNLTDDEVDYRFVDVDFETIVDTFKYHLERQSDIGVLNEVLNDFKADDTTVPSDSKPYILSEIFKIVDTNVTYGSTQYLRQLYLYMLDRPQIFGASVAPTFNINMGVVNIGSTEQVDIGVPMDIGVSNDIGVSTNTSDGNINISEGKTFVFE